MGANVNVSIVSPHGGRTIMALNPDQVAQLVDILDGHRAFKGDAFGPWFVEKLLSHTYRKATP